MATANLDAISNRSPKPDTQPPKPEAETRPRRKKTKVKEPTEASIQRPPLTDKLSMIGAVSSTLLSLVILAVSMPHLVSGVSTITRCSFATAVLMACIFDLSQILAEYALIVRHVILIPDRRLPLFATAIMIVCTCVSMTMNVKAFAANAQTTFEIVMAITWGMSLPILILLLTYIASVFVMRRFAQANQ